MADTGHISRACVQGWVITDHLSWTSDMPCHRRWPYSLFSALRRSETIARADVNPQGLLGRVACILSNLSQGPRRQDHHLTLMVDKFDHHIPIRADDETR